MHVHNITASIDHPRSMWHGSLAEARPTATTGPVKVVGVPQTMLKVAVVAASIWNRFLPEMESRLFNIEAKSLPGSIVGQIELPCLPPPHICQVSIDPSYPATLNVLVHEFGHGLGLPFGSRSGRGSEVDSSNHWYPSSVDPREIMNAVIHSRPYLSMYTLRAMDNNHRACVDDYQCSSGLRCVSTSIYESPGACEPKPKTIVDSAHADNPEVVGLAVTGGTIGVAGLALLL